MADELQAGDPPKRDWYKRLRIWCAVVFAVLFGGSLFYVHTYTGVVIGQTWQRESPFAKRSEPKVLMIRLKTKSGTVLLEDEPEELFGKQAKVGLPQASNIRYRIKARGISWLSTPNIITITRQR